MKYARQWTEHANISFEVVRTGDAEIRVTFSEQTVFSYVGTASRELSQEKATMSLRIRPNSLEQNYARAVLHGFGHALGLKHVHQVTPSGIPWNLEALYSYYEKTLNWSPGQVKLNVLNLLAADSGISSPDGNSVMLYSIPKDLTSNEVSIQGQGALTAADIALVSASFPSWNNLNASLLPTNHPTNPWQSIKEGGQYTLHLPISPPASVVPKVAIGLTNIYTILEPTTGDNWVRVTSSVGTVTASSIEVQVGTWAETRLLTGTSSVFWATPGSPNPVFQTGTYGAQSQLINQRIQFPEPYKTRPKVFVGLSRINLGNVIDLDITVVSADKDGFYLNVTSPGTIDAAINWVAWPGNHPGVETGTFYAGPTKGAEGGDKLFTIEGEIEFDTIFDRQPKVHFALSSFNIVKNFQFPIALTAEVSKTALKWSVSSWLDLGRVRGNYLVFKV